MFNLFTPQPAFDDVASERAKQTRANINAAAQSKLNEAAHFAQNGQVKEAQAKLQEYQALKCLADSIPRKMVAEKL